MVISCFCIGVISGILLVVINDYFINGYWWLFMVILLMVIGGYSWLLMGIILMATSGYFLNGY